MFRFTSRDVLWLMVVVGLTLGWWNEHRWLATVRKHAWVLRENLHYARWRYRDSEPSAALVPVVDWDLTDKPIP
jgi:hypothetical protein